MRPDVEKIWGNIKKGLQDGAAVAINKAEGLTQLGRSRLDIAEVKTRLVRLKADLGNEIYQSVQAGQSLIGDDKVIQQFCDRILECERELADSEERFKSLKAELEGIDA